MMFRTFSLTLATLAAVGLAGATAHAGGYSGGGGHHGYTGGGGHGPYCPHPGGSTIRINKPVHIYKPVNIHSSVRINKHIVINKPVNIHSSVRINKHIVINKGGGGSAQAAAWAAAQASAQSASASQAYAIASGGSSVVDVEAPRGGGDFGAVAVEQPCVEQWAIVVKAIHAECIGRNGAHHPATRMRPETWIDSSMNAEIYRCLEGSYLHVLIGDVVDSESGMAGVYQGAQALDCAPGQALRHYRDGAVKCAVQERVPDCTERRNMRRYGLGDLFFSYHAKVCARVTASAAPAPRTPKRCRWRVRSPAASATDVPTQGETSQSPGGIASRAFSFVKRPVSPACGCGFPPCEWHRTRA